RRLIPDVAVFTQLPDAPVVSHGRRYLGYMHTLAAEHLYRVIETMQQTVLQQCRIDTYMRRADAGIVLYRFKEIAQRCYVRPLHITSPAYRSFSPVPAAAAPVPFALPWPLPSSHSLTPYSA